MNIQAPEYQEHEEFRNRSRKLKEILEVGLDPYPHKFELTTTPQELTKRWMEVEVGSSEDAINEKTPKVCLAGRLVLFRAMGKNAFGQIQDDYDRIQIMCSRDVTNVSGLKDKSGVKPLKFIEKKIDLGDIVGVDGHLFRTHKGELTILVKTFTLLCKSLLPLPDKHSGLTDKGMRYRKRWLDLITNKEVVKQLKMRSHLIWFVRRFFEEAGFLEVETPVLQNIYGGAEARPFVTKLNALHQTMYLRIALEIAHKKLVVGGIDKVFEIGKIFRNEGIDKTHNPEFTMLEAYAAYWDYNDMMELMEILFEKIALHFFKTTKLSFKRDTDGEEMIIDLKAPWKRLTMKESLKEYARIDFDKSSDDTLKEILRTKTRLDANEYVQASRGKLMAFLFEELVEEHLIQPHHIIDHPIETTPLCKPHRNPELRQEGLVERFESFILTRELSNAYSELNDPTLQRALLEKQAKAREAGDEEAHPLDEEFIEAICQGMPPTAGIGIGIDRLVMLFTKAQSIRDVIYFPMMRPE